MFIEITAKKKMASAIPYDYRKQIIQGRQSGESFESLSMRLGYSQSGIKKIWYHYKQEGESSLYSAYENCGKSCEYDQEIFDLIDTIRTGKQGAAYVYSMFQLKHPDKKAPSLSTIKRYWCTKGTNRKSGRPSKQEKKTGQ